MRTIRSLWLLIMMAAYSPVAVWMLDSPRSCWPSDIAAWAESLAEWNSLSDDGRFQRAEGYYDAGLPEEAFILCGRILRENPSHIPTRALMNEVKFNPHPSWMRHEMQFFTRPELIPQQLALIESDAEWDRAQKALLIGDHKTAESALRQSLTSLNRCQFGIEAELRSKRVRQALNGLAEDRASKSGVWKKDLRREGGKEPLKADPRPEVAGKAEGESRRRLHR